MYPPSPKEYLALPGEAGFVANLVHLCGEDVGSNPGAWTVSEFLVTDLNIQYPVKIFAPYLGGRRGRVPSDSLREFLQEVNLYNSFNIFFFSIPVPAAQRRSRAQNKTLH
jgi:hypothetical protein